MNPANYSTISFPFLGLEVNPSRTFSIGPLSAHFYGLVIAFGLILAVVYACRRCTQYGIKEDDILDGVLWITPFAIICARLYYCIFSWSSYADNPISILYIWEGGLAIYGAVLGAAAGVIVFCRVKKIHLPALLDLVALGFLIGQSIGRWGNFFNREAFGAATESFFRMGLFNDRTQAYEYYHPTFLYESVWNACGFVLLHLHSKKRKYDGQTALLYVAWYGLGRALIEGLRVDSLYIGPLRVSQILAAMSCLAAIGALVWFENHPPKKKALPAEAAQEPAGEEDAEESFQEETVDEAVIDALVAEVNSEDFADAAVLEANTDEAELEAFTQETEEESTEETSDTEESAREESVPAGEG